MRVPIQRLPLLQPSRLRPRITCSGLSSSLISNQQRHPVSNESKFDSSTPLIAGQRPLSAAHREALEALEKCRAEMALWEPGRLQAYRSTKDSFANSYLRPGAPWGFVIVRAVYGPSTDAPWTKMLELLRSDVADSLAFENQIELLPRYQLTVIEDEATLAGADSYAVRRAFRAWVSEDLLQHLRDDEIERCGGTAQVRDKLRGNDRHHEATAMHPAALVPPRWQYCIFVDADCLRSLDMSSDFKYQDPAFKILTTDFKQSEEPVVTEEFTTDWDGGETDNDHEDVGWQYMKMSDYVQTYDSSIADPWSWEHFYQRPEKSWVDDCYRHTRQHILEA